MSQKRFLDYGTTADASKTKVMHQQLFAPQVLRADEPFFSASAPDQLLINPHSTIFENGLILVEDEIIAKTIPTTYSSANYTVYYEHIDEDIIGGSAAILQVVGGLKTLIPDAVILGWVVYPGGTVPLDNTMLYPNWRGQVVGGQAFDETVIWMTSGMALQISGSSYTSLTDGTVQWETIAGSQQVDFSARFISKNFAEVNQKIRVFNADTNVQLTRVSGVPAADEFNLDSNGIMTFNVADVGKVMAISDITYGPNVRIWANDSTSAVGYVDLAITFPVKNVPVRTIYFEYVIVDDFTVDAFEILDINGDAASFETSKSEPTDGRIARLTVRLTSGIFQGTSGEAFVVRLRETLQPSGIGADLRARASVYDLPI